MFCLACAPFTNIWKIIYLILLLLLLLLEETEKNTRKERSFSFLIFLSTFCKHTHKWYNIEYWSGQYVYANNIQLCKFTKKISKEKYLVHKILRLKSRLSVKKSNHRYIASHLWKFYQYYVWSIDVNYLKLRFASEKKRKKWSTTFSSSSLETKQYIIVVKTVSPLFLSFKIIMLYFLFHVHLSRIMYMCSRVSRELLLTASSTSTWSSL